MMKKIVLAAALTAIPAAFGLYSAFASSDTQSSYDYAAPCYEQSYDDNCYNDGDRDHYDRQDQHHYRHHHYRGCGW